ncbi:MAG TPA: PQQ-binding-like beta-propeller repeat protein [Acidisphaera sp.]|nr:PQQ-binding-like beta-propeller repeat protein [Acidisphaera sp.]
MTTSPAGRRRGAIGRRALLRASLLGAPLAVGGCSWFDDIFEDTKTPLPGKRISIVSARATLTGATHSQRVVLPPVVENAAWPQAGGNPAHLMGHLALGERPVEAWSSDIGEGGGFRQKILCQPVAADGIIYTMDSDAIVKAFDTRAGRHLWSHDTTDENDDSTNVGGGLAIEGGTLYAVNGLAWLVALDPKTGRQKWRRNLGAPARSAPTIAAGRLFVVVIGDKLLCLSAADGHELWTHQAANAATGLLGQPAPAYADGLVVAGFGSGEMAALRAETGGVAWIESLASPRGRSNVGDVSAIRGLPVIDQGAVFAISLGGLMLSDDQRTGRRLWERDVAGEDSLWLAGDWVFVVSREQQIAAVKRDDGSLAWVTDLPRYENEEKQRDPITWFGPVLASDRLIVASTTGKALSVSPYTGEILGQADLSGAASLGPICAERTVFIVTDDGRVIAFR